MKRIIGLDVARAVAIAGMVMVNFKVVMGAETRGPDWLQSLTGLVDGRASAMFVILAGVGASLMTAQARRDRDPLLLDGVRRRLIRRAVFLLVVGYLFIPIWPADILHYYAFYIGIGALLLSASDRALWFWGLMASALFAGLYTFAGYWDQLDPVSLTYRGLWTPVGLVRNLLFNGWHPVLPWVGFFLAGMWLGRRDLASLRTRWIVFGVGFLMAAIGEAVGASNAIEFDIVAKDANTLGVVAGNGALLAGDPLPPGPIYLMAAGGTAVALIVLCLEAGLRWPDSVAVRWTARTGQMALTIYFAHVLLGMGILEGMGRFGSETLWFSLGASAVFLAVSVVFSVLWRQRFERGPVEWLMRRLAG